MFDYENLEGYKKAFSLNQAVYRFLKNSPGMSNHIKNQLGRASLSIMLNIAEGSAKFSLEDKRNFYVTARGSVFEWCAIISFLHQEGEVPLDFKNELYSRYDEISRMLYAMIRKLEKAG